MLICGDSNIELDKFEENSIDSFVTDPPYGIRFMNNKWDYDVPNTGFWKKVFRVLKPGGHALVFCGTRTQHRMVTSIEDAGFEVRDVLCWLYGCLSEDTEILTECGWERYHKDISQSPVLCYNINNRGFTFEKPIRSFYYENKHPAYHIKSNFTDQIVSRNHRVLVERGGREEFIFAEALEQQENIPFLESLSDLPETISNNYKGTSIKKQDLLKKMQESAEEAKSQKEKTDILSNKDILQNLWQRVSFEKRQKIKVLLSQLFGKIKAMDKKNWGSWSRWLDKGNERKVKNKIYWEEQPSVEGRSNLFEKSWKLSTSKVCSLPRRIFFYGKKRWLCNGTQTVYGTKNKPSVTKNRGCASHRPQSTEQLNRKSNVVQNQQRSQKIRRTRAKIEEINYLGMMWCVEVPTGSFVARRNGKIFITGNSGFPKSLNIAKQMLPKSEEAKFWEGWGTALKPGCEFITLVRKPISERNIALNVLKWGVGGINIDATRIELNGEIVPINKLEGWSGFGQEKRPDYIPTINTKGRWPANVILDDIAGKLLDNQTEKSEGASRFFYCAKPSQKEKGLDNHHQTVKPTALMEFLVKLITPIKGVCCDPFMGSGSTIVACKKLGYNYIGIEKEPEFFTLAEKRIKEI